MDELIDMTVERLLEAIEMCPEGMREIIVSKLVAKLGPVAIPLPQIAVTTIKVSATDPHKECNVQVRLFPADTDIANVYRQMINDLFDYIIVENMFADLIDRYGLDDLPRDVTRLSLDEQFQFICQAPGRPRHAVDAGKDTRYTDRSISPTISSADRCVWRKLKTTKA